ncbi:hypothetical protein ACF3DV_13685 [Chlorogloeopsis fritschii PCC 9212]|uniref:Phytase-like domain-containing protein n=1 Tax=Chlorogloeopsis fritschii PCC 6912 TaxID=211165 RepID=A0A3S0YKK6_CHLFR|nr:hypothetical protein [Chlorogloeopsis fritschii]RUR86785.1 hypothetical protein PCC6912_02280 [Chlorogloeopsis fritschii PCC 6912]
MSPLKRRRFTQLAAASLTSTIVADVSSKALAQNNGQSQGNEQSQEVLYGVKLFKESKAQNQEESNARRNREDETPTLELIAADVGTGNVVSKKNVPSQSVDNPSSTKKKSRAFFTGESDRVTKATALGDGNLVISTVSNQRDGYVNHLTFTVEGAKKDKFKAKKILDLEPNQTVESLLSLPKDQLLCIVGIEGVPPFAFITLDSKNGKIISEDELALPPLPLNHRFANLCQDAKGNIFATETGPDGSPILIYLNLQEKATLTGKVKIQRLTPLNIEGRPLINDVEDLNFSSSGQLYALTADKGGKKTLFKVEARSGKMESVKEFEAEKFAFVL